MDTHILPIMINSDGCFSVHVAKTSDPQKWRFNDTPRSSPLTKTSVLKSVPKGLLTGKGQDQIFMGRIPHPSETEAFVVIAGNDEVFVHSNTDRSRWYHQNEMKFGPLPEGTAHAADMPALYLDSRSGSLSEDNIVALLSAVHVVRAKRLGFAASAESAVVLSLIAKDPRQIAIDLATKVDKSLPLIGGAKSDTAQDAWKQITGMVTRLGTAATRALAQATSATAGGASRPRATAAAAAADAKIRTSGVEPKPA